MTLRASNQVLCYVWPFDFYDMALIALKKTETSYDKYNIQSLKTTDFISETCERMFAEKPCKN